MSLPIAYTVDQAAKLIGFSRSTLYKDIRDGCLPIIKRGRSARILRSDLIAYARKMRITSRELKSRGATNACLVTALPNQKPISGK